MPGNLPQFNMPNWQKVLDIEREVRDWCSRVHLVNLVRNLYVTSTSNNEVRLQCQICQTKTPMTVLDVCGHLVCQACVERLESKHCPFCRKVFTKSIKIYHGAGIQTSSLQSNSQVDETMPLDSSVPQTISIVPNSSQMLTASVNTELPKAIIRKVNESPNASINKVNESRYSDWQIDSGND